MPPDTTQYDALGSQPETTAFPDSGSSTNDFLAECDPEGTCRVLKPEQCGIDDPTVSYARAGTCPPHLLREAEVCSEKEIPLTSKYTQRDGLVLVTYDLDGNLVTHNLVMGEITYDVRKGICDSFPADQVGIDGIIIKPLTSPAEVQGRLETGKAGNEVARLHGWKGRFDLLFRDGTKMDPPLGEGEQVVVDPDTSQVLESFCVDPKAKANHIVNQPFPPVSSSPTPTKVKPEEYATDHAPSSHESADGGCQIPNSAPQTLTFGEAITLGAPLIAYAARRQIRRLFVWITG